MSKKGCQALFYVTNLLELFAESFSKVVYIWHPWIDYLMVEKYQPDIVINCTIERFLATFPNDYITTTCEQIEIEKDKNKCLNK